MLLCHCLNLLFWVNQWQIQDFPLGGAEPLGVANLRRGHFSAKTYAKTKELDPVGGRPGSANVNITLTANSDTEVNNNYAMSSRLLFGRGQAGKYDSVKLQYLLLKVLQTELQN